MKSKILSNNHSSTNQSSNISTTGSYNRNRNSLRCSNTKYSSQLTSSKTTKISDSDKDICNNNNNTEDCSPDNDYQINPDVAGINDSINNNSLTEGTCYKVSETILEELHELHIGSEDSIHSSAVNEVEDQEEADGDNTDIDNTVDIDDECRKSPGSIPENRTNLIVNYLPQHMSQEEMRAIFSSVGEVESCKLIRDKTTGQSLSYGFVNYQDAKDANTAIKEFNGLALQNKIIKVSLARPSSETIKGANLYICGLPKSMSQMELDQLFSKYGTIITCRILLDNVTGNSKGVAFIRFDQRHEAETAIKVLNGHTPPNGTEPITVKLANTPFNINNSTNSQLLMSHNQHSEYATTSPNHSCSIPATSGVRCMVPNMRSIVSTCSDIMPRLDVVLQNNGHPSPGCLGQDYGQSAGHVISNGHQMPFPQRSMICPPQIHSLATFQMNYPLQSLAGPPGPASVQNNHHMPLNGTHPQPQYLSIDPITASTHILDSNLCYLLVYNLSPDTKEQTLWQTFGPFGAVHSVSVARDPVTGKCKGFGFVTMPNYHEAILAAQQLNGNPLDNRHLQIVFNPGLSLSAINQYVLPTVAP